MAKTKKGKPILGSTVEGFGTNFAIFSRNAISVTLEIYEEFYSEEPLFKIELDKNINKTGDIWHIFVEDVFHGMFYGWRVGGVYLPKEGQRFNANKLLIDPYAKSIAGTIDCNLECIYGYEKENRRRDLSFSNLDSKYSQVKSVIVEDSIYNWENDIHPRIPLKETIIYEMHVRLFTMNKNSKVKNRGTFDGIVEKLSYLKDLGVTAIELLPIFEFSVNSIINTDPKTGERLKDIWGYNPLNFFAVTGNYSYGLKLGEQVFQFKDFVKAVHKAGLEVILDVVYNHTGEGNEFGPTISFKGIDNNVYYVLEDNKRYYSNYSGTGNTLNCSHAVVKEMVIDSLRYWVTEMHVDGFRFDLAAILGRGANGEWIGDLSLLKDIADDPIISGSKLIAEGWDAAGGYYVGEFPVGWAEWNGKFRDTVRKFIKGENGQVGDLATRIVGSPDLFEKYGRKPYHSINFITAHDGFTMWDLVSYNEKHNLNNGEENRDGANDNNSWNHGVEGETKDKKIIKLRKQQIKNFVVIMTVSQGIPMLLMGDEFCRTQNGNNNAYCQDNKMTWLDWDKKEEFKDVYRFFKKMIEFRKNHPSFKREAFFKGKDFSGDDIPDITWHGAKLNEPDWSNESHSLAFMISGKDFSGEIENDNNIYVALNSYWEDIEFEIPKMKNTKWYLVVDSSKKMGEDFLDNPKEIKAKTYKVKARSSIILISRMNY
ncbi:glycogen debranching protein GlgX [Haliovirga abyssi]|uniref:Glycogen operon protein GlgX homolog n=1 Tax=Haliovirga abyssi TaxID=2996794 RepID=A0AAU9DTU0_9FUSO|nr:glycogen debranching protein GlgX [Haliovirga abyssi]BDU50604.1 glycogen operon protein GlgX homolog [Haliovirga abyssi]